MRPLPLKWRVSLLVAGTILVGTGFIALTAYVEVKQSLWRSLDQALESMASSAMAALSGGPIDAEAEAEVRAIVGVTPRRQDACYRVWLDGASGDLLSGPDRPAGRPGLLSADSLRSVASPPVGGSRLFDLEGTREGHRAVWLRSRLGKETLNVALALSSHGANDELEECRDKLLYAAGAVMVITIAATTLLVGVGLRPIGSTARALAAVTERNVGDAHIEIADAPQELEPFVRAVSDMLARLADALAEQKQFVSDASHELRTPLSVARSTVDAARVKDRTPQEYRLALDEVREDLDRMGAMVEDLLVMARLDETARTRGAEAFDLKDLIEDLAGTYQAEAARHGGSLTLELRPAPVRGDRAQLRRMFSNLLDNALRHGPEGGTVRVSLSVEDGAARVRVHDEGGRIPPESLPRLFDRFYRTDQSRTRTTGGVGLGLSIAREIAVRHGGDIAATSSPASGTCFTVTMPTA